MDQAIEILNPDFWESEWNRAQNISSVKITRENDSKWVQFWDYMSEIYEDIEKAYSELVIKAISLMKREGLFNAEFKLLEIGAGTGAFTIPLSSEVKNIVALDSSKGMLNRLESKLKALNISNVIIIHDKWEFVNFNERFDFVFTAFCPAISSKEMLIKMKNITKNYACLLTFSKHDEQLKMRNALWEVLTGHQFVSESYHIIYPFGILYSSGHRPQLKKILVSQTIERETAKLQEQYERYFGIFFVLSKRQKAIIRDFLLRKSDNGKIIFQQDSEIYIMWW